MRLDSRSAQAATLETHELVSELGAEANVVQRLRLALQDKGLSQSKLARLMREAQDAGYGRALTQSEISKLVRGEGNRQIKIDQLVCLSRVLSIPVTELLLPLGATELHDGWRLYTEALEVARQIRDLEQRYEDLVHRLRSRAARSEELRARIRAHREDTVERVDRELMRGDEDLVADLPSDRLEEWLQANYKKVPAIRLAQDVLSERSER